MTEHSHQADDPAPENDEREAEAPEAEVEVEIEEAERSLHLAMDMAGTPITNYVPDPLDNEEGEVTDDAGDGAAGDDDAGDEPPAV